MASTMNTIDKILNRPQNQEVAFRLMTAIEEVAREEFEWGVWDCSTTAAYLFEQAWRIDVGWKPTYRTAFQCGLQMERAGGVDKVFHKVVREAGLKRYLHPYTGDIGLLHSDKVMYGSCFAVYLAGDWVTQAPEGVGFIKQAIATEVWSTKWARS